MLLAESLLGTSSTAANYIEDVFSTYLYTGNATIDTQILNGIDLLTYGGLVWFKNRTSAEDHVLIDSARGFGGTDDKRIFTNSTSAQVTGACDWAGVSSNNGFVLNGNGVSNRINANGVSYTSWTFRKQAKFFDIVTYTGTGANRTIAHNLGSVPGCIMVKRTDTTAAWAVYHRSLANTQYMVLNTTAAAATGATYWNSTTPTASVFSLGTSTDVNASGGTYVAYLFAHDAGGFGATGSDNVISCGSFTTDGSGNVTVTLGYEPQFLIVKRTDSTDSWKMLDNMRGWPNGGNDSLLYPNLANAESAPANYGHPTSTGFTGTFDASAAHIYIAIRRGPMKTPTTGTSVFEPYQTSTGRLIGDIYDSNLNPPDLYINQRQTSGLGAWWQDRLRGWKSFSSRNSSAEEATTYIKQSGKQDELQYIANWDNATGYANWYFRRAPGFFDVVCYTGTGVAKTESHNLQTVPELIICKNRTGIDRDWAVYIAPMGNNYFACLNNGSFQGSSSTMWNDTTPTSSVFTVGTNIRTNNSGQTYVAYLFATVAGVSKVGSYTGTGTTQQINCGFTAGARFVLIKRTDSTGDWYVWDSARGIVAGNDPYLLLNSTAAEVTSTDYVDTYSAGFEISSTAPAAINANGGSFIFLAIA